MKRTMPSFRILILIKMIYQNTLPTFYTARLSCYYAGKYDEAARWINNLLNEVSLKKYPYAQLEIKTLLALQYCLQSDYDLFNQLNQQHSAPDSPVG